MTKCESKILDLFNVVIVERKDILSTPDVGNAEWGFVTDFIPTEYQLHMLRSSFQPLEMRTLFSVEERETGDLRHLLGKQILHYIEVYGLGLDGHFTVPLANGKAVTMKHVRAATMEELGGMVRELVYANAPIEDTGALKDIIVSNGIVYDVNKIKNNEFRVLAFDQSRGDLFDSGDDAMRWLCLQATESPLLIKSKEVVEALTIYWQQDDPSGFLSGHEVQLASVFHRHKRLILALKNKKTGAVVNRIARLAKKHHVPIRQHVSKRFVAAALGDTGFDMDGVLPAVGMRDKMKYLNLLAYKRTRQERDAFTVRNGKIFVREGAKLYEASDIDRVEKAVLASIEGDLSGLVGKTIRMDANVDYGLPVSRKQTIGNLPYGTTITVDSPKISSGIHWINSGGASDLDLSTVDGKGLRVGWGEFSGYVDDEIVFSGDVVNAPNGAMEFMTSENTEYGLFVNIFSGEVGAEMELVVGEATRERWIGDPVIREKHILRSRGCLLGFVNGKSFTVYGGRIGNEHSTNGKAGALAARGTYEFWTARKLLDATGIPYSLDKDAEAEYDLGYESFSYDKLETLLLN